MTFYKIDSYRQAFSVSSIEYKKWKPQSNTEPGSS